MSDISLIEQEQEHPYQTFVYAIKSPNTRRGYILRLKRFFNHCGLQGHLEDEQAVMFMNRAKTDKGWAYNHIVAFLQTFKERIDRKKIAATTIWNYVAPIKLFCEMNELDVNWKKLFRGLPRRRSWSRDRAPTREEIVQLCKYPDRRIKPIVYSMVSGGFRLGAWDYLKWGDVQYIEGKDIARMRIYAEEDEEYFTLISGEAYKALKEWIDFRAMSGEHITKDSWIMRHLWDVTTMAVVIGGISVTRPKQLHSDGIKTLIRNAMKAQGLRTQLEPGKRRYQFKAIHGFRKFFKTHAEQAMKNSNVEKLMGHVSDDYSANSYYKPTEDDLIEDYLKAVPLLTIENEVRAARQDTQRIEKEIEDLKEKIAQLAQFYVDSGQAKPKPLEKN